MLGVDLTTIEILLPDFPSGRFADRSRLEKGIYFTCHWRNPSDPSKPETVRTARAGTVLDLRDFSRIGTIGLERATNSRINVAYVAIDIDDKTGDQQDHIEHCILRLRSVDFIEVRRSTSGKGLHLYVPLNNVFLSNLIPDDESYESWKAALVLMRAEYRDVKARVESHVRDILRDTVPIDAVGGNNAMWMYTEMGNERSFQLLQEAKSRLDVIGLPAAEAYTKKRVADTASPRPRSAPGLPKFAPPRIVAFIQNLESWRPREVPDFILGHFHLAHLQPALLNAGIAGFCGCRTEGTDLTSPNAYLVYNGDGRLLTEYAVCAMNGSQPLWESKADPTDAPIAQRSHPRLVLGSVSMNQLEALGLTCPDSAKLNGCTEIHDDVQYIEMAKFLCLQPLMADDSELSPFADGQRGVQRFPRLEWRPGQVTIRHDMGTGTARKVADNSKGFWQASSRGVSCSIRLTTQGSVLPKANEYVIFDDDLKQLLYDHFCMIDPAHVNTGNRIDGLFCAPYYIRNDPQSEWQPVTTTADLTASLGSLANVNVKSASRARQILRDHRATYITHDILKPLGRFQGEHGVDCWNNPLNTIIPKQNTRRTTWELDCLQALSGNVFGGREGAMNVPYLIWWLKERVTKQAAVLPTLHFQSAKNAALFRRLVAACFLYPCVYNLSLSARLNMLPVRTLLLYTPRLIDEIPKELSDRILMVRDSAGPLTTYSVIVSAVSQGITDGAFDIILSSTDFPEQDIQPYMGHIIEDMFAGKYNGG